MTVRLDLPAARRQREQEQRQTIKIVDHEDRTTAPGSVTGEAPRFPAFLSAADFVAGYRPQKPLIRAWDMKAGWLYAVTAPTGGAKTAIALAEAILLASEGRKVAYLAGENADDVRARVILMQAMLGIETLPPSLKFVDRTFNLHEGMEHVRHEVASMDGADLIIVDTSPAFHVASGATEENSNPEVIQWALRLRELTRLPGSPTTLALCHPIKRPQSVDDCLPRGGGGFLAEIDGNYAIWPAAEDGEEKYFELSTVGKFRGYFEPITYRLQRATCDRLVDADGNPVHSVWVQRADNAQIERAAADQTEDENAVLMAMADYPGKSLSDWARILDWHMPSGPAKYRVERAIKRLAKHKFTKLGRGNHYQLTAAGKQEAVRVTGLIRGAAK
jgi:hypothetical protein